MRSRRFAGSQAVTRLEYLQRLDKVSRLCLDRIATDLQLLTRGLDLYLWRVDFTKVDSMNLPLPLPLIECTMRMGVRLQHREKGKVCLPSMCLDVVIFFPIARGDRGR